MLLILMRDENEEMADLEWERFKMLMVANNPGQAKEILRALDDSRPPEQPNPDPQPVEGAFNDEEKSFVVSQMRSLGFAVEDY